MGTGVWGQRCGDRGVGTEVWWDKGVVGQGSGEDRVEDRGVGQGSGTEVWLDRGVVWTGWRTGEWKKCRK